MLYIYIYICIYFSFYLSYYSIYLILVHSNYIEYTNNKELRRNSIGKIENIVKYYIKNTFSDSHSHK